MIAPEIREAIRWSHAPVMYISNLVSQAGETDGFSVSDHVAAINKYLGERKVDVVVANNGRVDPAISDVYEAAENKIMVELDAEAVRAMGAEVIADDVCIAADGRIRHDELKTAYLVFSYLMR